jgi:hypothetical protein
LAKTGRFSDRRPSKGAPSVRRMASHRSSRVNRRRRRSGRPGDHKRALSRRTGRWTDIARTAALRSGRTEPWGIRPARIRRTARRCRANFRIAAALRRNLRSAGTCADTCGSSLRRSGRLGNHSKPSTARSDTHSCRKRGLATRSASRSGTRRSGRSSFRSAVRTGRTARHSCNPRPSLRRYQRWRSCRRCHRMRRLRPFPRASRRRCRPPRRSHPH